MDRSHTYQVGMREQLQLDTPRYELDFIVGIYYFVWINKLE